MASDTFLYVLLHFSNLQTIIQCMHLWLTYDWFLHAVEMIRNANTMDLSPRMRFYFRWGQKCALFRAAPIIAVERRCRGFTHRGSCNFFLAIYTGVQWARTIASCHMETRQQVIHVPLECGACEFPVSLRRSVAQLPVITLQFWSTTMWFNRLWSTVD